MKQQKTSRQTTASHGERSVPEKQTWSGPLPPPAALEHFETIVPGAASRLIEMAEAEQRHRHKLESGQLEASLEGVRLAGRDSLIGMLLGATVALTGMGAALVSFFLGAPWPLSVAFLSLPIMIVAIELIRRKP